MKNKFIYIVIRTVLIVAWFVFRGVIISNENARVVFNIARDNLQNGASVQTIIASKKTDFLREPLFIKNNRADVSCVRIGKFSIGQTVGDGKIISISNKINLDTGMCMVKTNGVNDGNNFVLIQQTGFFIPSDNVYDNAVMINENGIATSRAVRVVDQDLENSVISDGIIDGDIIIVSDIENGAKIK
jgi:hypothetical protein